MTVEERAELLKRAFDLETEAHKVSMDAAKLTNQVNTLATDLRKVVQDDIDAEQKDEVKAE